MAARQSFSYSNISVHFIKLFLLVAIINQTVIAQAHKKPVSKKMIIQAADHDLSLYFEISLPNNTTTALLYNLHDLNRSNILEIPEQQLLARKVVNETIQKLQLTVNQHVLPLQQMEKQIHVFFYSNKQPRSEKITTPYIHTPQVTMTIHALLLLASYTTSQQVTMTIQSKAPLPIKIQAIEHSCIAAYNYGKRDKSGNILIQNIARPVQLLLNIGTCNNTINTHQ